MGAVGHREFMFTPRGGSSTAHKDPKCVRDQALSSGLPLAQHLKGTGPKGSTLFSSAGFEIKKTFRIKLIGVANRFRSVSRAARPKKQASPPHRFLSLRKAIYKSYLSTKLLQYLSAFVSLCI